MEKVKISLNIQKRLSDRLRKLAEENRRTLTAELEIALEGHLNKPKNFTK